MNNLDLERDISLYLHIPYCKSKCSYCAFYSITNHDTLEMFYQTLIKQIEEITNLIKKPFYTIFIGGGNPAILGFDRLQNIAKLTQKYGKAKEFTIEMNPEYITDEVETLFGDINRLSIGIQSFSTDALQTLGRDANKEININALNRLTKLKEKYNFTLNCDLITAIPGYQLSETLEDIKILHYYNIDHISLYSLTFEEGCKLCENVIPLSEADDRVFLEESWKLLDSFGYKQYEVSNFAKDSKECLHNKVYWSLGQYIGLGPSSESSVGYKNITSLRENDDVFSFIKNPTFTSYDLTKDEYEEEYLLTNLRTIYGINKAEFQNRFDMCFDDRYSSAISKLNKRLYINNDESFSLTREGLFILDQVVLTLAMVI